MTEFICTNCKLYVYDELKGDKYYGLAPDTTISKFPEDWHCPVCFSDNSYLKSISDLGESSTENEVESNQNLTLSMVRKNALERLKGICTVNKVCDGQPVRFCMGQKYGAPIGLGGAGKGLGFSTNVQALDRVKLKQRLISKHIEPDMTTTLYGKSLDMPILASSLSGVSASMGGGMRELDFAKAILFGCKEAGTLGLIGNTSDDGQELTGLEAVKAVELGIPILKPQQNDRLLELINLAENFGATAVGIDLDGVGSTNWERAGKPVYRKTTQELQELVDSTELPFIAKSIMCTDDALAAVDAGVAGIDVSNHGGRVLDSTRGVAEVLPEIKAAVNRKVTITAGGGVRTGYDVIKLLGLGADGVLIGRDLVRAALGSGGLGVKLHLQYLKKELRRAMILTSCNKISEIDDTIIDSVE